MNGFLVLGEILAIVCIIVGLVLIGLSIYNKRVYDKGASYIFAMGVAFVIMAISAYALMHTERLSKQAEEMIADGAKVYVDGQEVDADTIDMNDYDLKNIKDGNVILSRKEKSIWVK